MINKYRGIEKYLKLVEDIGLETDKKINELAILFSNYCNEILELCYTDNSMNFPKGYPKILQ